MRFQKYPDTCGRGLSSIFPHYVEQVSNFQIHFEDDSLTAVKLILWRFQSNFCSFGMLLDLERFREIAHNTRMVG